MSSTLKDLEVINFIAENGKVPRKVILENFGRRMCDNLPTRVEESILHSYWQMGDNDQYYLTYELHNSMRKQMRVNGNHNVSGREISSQTWQEIEFSPEDNVRIRIGADVHEYTPEDGYKKNGMRAHNFGEWMAIWKNLRTE